MRFRSRFPYAAAATVVGVLLLTDVAMSQAPGPDVYRVEHVYRGKTITSFSCEGFDCVGFSSAGPIEVTFPSSMGTIDVTASLTIEYETTRGDDAIVAMHMDPPGSTSRPMAPGKYLLGADKTSTTLTWFRGGVEASDRPFKFGFGLSPAARVDIPLEIAAHEAVIVIEAVPSS